MNGFQQFLQLFLKPVELYLQTSFTSFVTVQSIANWMRSNSAKNAPIPDGQLDIGMNSSFVSRN
jgi:hypothetical protein